MASTTARGATTELLSHAVHRHPIASVDGVLERLFTFAFRDLVYPMIWEDARVDLAALQIEPTTRLVTIASGGCNVLNYLLAGPERVHAVDLNRAHVALNKLKLAAIQNLADAGRFHKLFATSNDRSNVALFDKALADRVDAETRAYWNGRDATGRRRISRLARNFYRQGLLGRFITFAHVVAWAYGRDPRRLMTAGSRAEQIQLFETELAPLFDRRFVRFLLGHRAALYGLGIPPAQYKALIGDANHMADVVRERLRKLACDFEFKDNHFAWAAFNRGFASDAGGAHPDYLHVDNFRALKAGVDRVTVDHTSFTAFLEHQTTGSLDRYVLLDAQDWMDDQDLSRLWSEITRTARTGARVIFRTAGTETILPGRVPAAILNRWQYEAQQSADLTRQDRSAIYGGFHLYVLKSGA